MVRVRAARGTRKLLTERRADEGIVGEVIRSGRARRVDDVRRERTYLAVRPTTLAQLSVPLASPRGILGAIARQSDRSRRPASDLTFATLFAQQAAITIQRVLLHEQLLRESRLSHEVAIAAEILKGLMPTTAPAYPGLQVFGRSRMAESVGGDVFDFIPYPDNELGCPSRRQRARPPGGSDGRGAPRDAAGAGQRGATPAGDVRPDQRVAGPRRTRTELRHGLLRNPRHHGAQDGVRKRRPSTPARRAKRRHHRAAFRDRTGAGVPHIAPMREGYAIFERGEGLVLYTDGVTDVGPSPEEFFEVAGLQSVIKRLWTRDAEAIGNGVIDEVARRGGNELHDDATVVVVKFD